MQTNVRVGTLKPAPSDKPQPDKPTCDGTWDKVAVESVKRLRGHRR